MTIEKFTIIRDTREKPNHGWWFDEDDMCAGTVSRKVDIGDYSIEGLENLICLERKESVSELANNVIQERFAKQLRSMKDFKYSFLLLEFDWNDIEGFPMNTDLPLPTKLKIEIKPSTIYGKLISAQLKYNIKVLPCGDRICAEKTAYKILRKIYQLHAVRY